MHSIAAGRAPTFTLFAIYICFWVGFAVQATPAVELGGNDTTPDLIFAELAGKFRKHCVKVFIHGKSHDGKAPQNDVFANDIRNERPTLTGGYWWDERHVIVEDQVLQDQFIRAIEIGLPYSDMRYPARIVGRFVRLQAVLLEVQPGEGGILPQAFPLQFIDGDTEEAIVLGYEWARGEWGVAADIGMGSSYLTDDGTETIELKSRGVFVDEKGFAIGLAFGSRLIIDEDIQYWTGRDLHYTPLFDIDDAAASQKTLTKKLNEAILETRFRLRVKVDDDDDVPGWMIDLDEGPVRSGGAEIRAAAMVVGENHLLVPLPLAAEGIARIENIVVLTASGREIPAHFTGALRDYMAVFIQTEEALPIQNVPDGFTLLNPLVMPEEAFRPEKERADRPVMQYLQRWRIDYTLGRRREMVDYDRWIGTLQGYRDDTVIHTFTNEEDGSLAFDVENRLAAVALTPRILEQNRDAQLYGNQVKVTAGFRPLDFLHQRLQSPGVFDPAMRPVKEVDGQRLIDLGVEFQGLDENTSRLFLASNETRGGRIGLLVTHVYPGSLADSIGIREHDILLRLYVEGKNEPMELRTSGFAHRGFMDLSEMSSQSLTAMIQFMPPPWPSREDVVSTLLTATGTGKSVRVEYMREGEAHRAEFTTRYTDPDYRNAKKEKFPALGLTVKPVTYEVQRYLRRPDASGVIISKVEDGGKSSVGGLHQYILVTHVDGQPTLNVEDFREKVSRFEKGEATAVELTVEGFGKTRLVKIE